MGPHHLTSTLCRAFLMLLLVNGIFSYRSSRFRYGYHRHGYRNRGYRRHGHHYVHDKSLYPAGFSYDTYSNCVSERTNAVCDDKTKYARYRTVDGTCNNIRHPTLGSSKTPVRRLLRASYADPLSIEVPIGFPHTNPKVAPANEISEKLFQVERESTGNTNKIATLFMTFGQFLDHDFTLVHEEKCKIPKGKDCRSKSAWKYPCFPILFENKNTRCTPFGRSNPICKKLKYSTRKHRNELTSYIDASQIYSGDKEHYEDLQKNDRSGQMKITKDGKLPFDPKRVPCPIRGGCSLVGEGRGDENVPLHTMHTLWVREHNRIAHKLKQINGHWTGKEIFDETRKIIGGIWQHIVYNEYVPVLTKLPKYRGYDKSINPSVTNAFATAAFRYGHSLIPNQFARLNNNFDVIKEPLSLQNSFRNRIPINEDGIESIMFGLIGNESGTVDTKFAHGIARKLFVLPGRRGHMDLLALNIQRGRDHGLQTYGAYRDFCRLPKITSWRALDRVMQQGAARVFWHLYKHPSDIDLFAAGIAEKHATQRDGRGNIEHLEVGPTFTCLFQHQFESMRDGDRFFYENSGVFTPYKLQSIKKVTMATILCNNLKGIVSIQPNAFHVGDNAFNRRISCSRIPKLNLNAWKEHRVIGDSEQIDDNDVENIVEEVNDISNDPLDEELENMVDDEDGDEEEFKNDNDNTEYVEDNQEDSKREVDELNKFYLEKYSQDSVDESNYDDEEDNFFK